MLKWFCLSIQLHIPLASTVPPAIPSLPVIQQTNRLVVVIVIIASVFSKHFNTTKCGWREFNDDDFANENSRQMAKINNI